MGNSRRAYACVRVGYYALLFYHLEDPGRSPESLASLYGAMSECLYYARHVWNDVILWGLLSHELRWLLHREADCIPRRLIAPVVRGLAALWTELRMPNRTIAIYEELESLLDAGRGDAESRKSQCSLLRRQGMVSVTRGRRQGLNVMAQ